MSQIEQNTPATVPDQPEAESPVRKGKPVVLALIAIVALIGIANVSSLVSGNKKSAPASTLFASSGPSGTALAGHFSAQRCTCYPSQAWAWAKACLSAATAKPLKARNTP